MDFTLSKYEELLDFLELFNFKKFCIDEKNNELIQVSDKKKIIELCADHENTIGRNIFCQKSHKISKKQKY